jgi:hypothetical protein
MGEQQDHVESMSNNHIRIKTGDALSLYSERWIGDSVRLYIQVGEDFFVGVEMKNTASQLGSWLNIELVREHDKQRQRAETAEAKYQCELEYRLALSRTVNAELKLLNASALRAEKWKARAEALEERNDTTPLDAIKTVLEYSDFQGWGNAEAEDAFCKLRDWLQFLR